MAEPLYTAADTTLVLSKDDIAALGRSRAKMPQITTPVDLASALRAIQQIKETLETRDGMRGSKVEKAVTVRDLLASGIAGVTIGGRSYAARPDPGSGNVTGVGPMNDVTIPPSPTGFRLMGAITNVIAAWDRPNFHNFAYAEIWRSSTDNLGEAVLIGQTPAFTFADSIGAGLGFYYWIRFVSTGNIAGPFNAQAGTYGHTGYDASYLLDVLAANPPAGVNYNPLLYVQSDPNLVIDGTHIPTGVYMNSAYIRALSVTNAMIANLAVDNAKIANLDAVKITAGDIDADRMRANIVEAAVGRFNVLSALSASLGTVQIDSNGWLRTAGVASYMTGTGLWMGYDAGNYKFRVGNPAGHCIFWDGDQLNITGNLYSTGDGTFRGTFYSGGYTGFQQVPANQGGAYIGADGFTVGVQAYNNGVNAMPAYISLYSPGYALTMTAQNFNLFGGPFWEIRDTGNVTFNSALFKSGIGVQGDINANGHINCVNITASGTEIALSTFATNMYEANGQVYTLNLNYESHKMFYSRLRVGGGSMRIVIANRLLNNQEITLATGPFLDGSPQNGIYFSWDQAGSGSLNEAFVFKFTPGTWYIHYLPACGDQQPNGVTIVTYMRDIP